jgi:DegV family protein with EDD domain
VVDAGAKAFVRLIEGIVRLIDGQPTAGAAPSGSWVPDAAAVASVAPERDYRFCTEALVRGGSLPEPAVVRSRLRELGGSIVLSPAATLLKIHIHTDEPERVFSLARGWGTLEASKAEDMREQHDRLQAPARRLAIVVDSSCDLPHEIIERHGITVVPIQVMDGDRSYLDRVDITAAEIYRRMRDERAVFTTSQPAPGAFATAFRSALDRTATDEVVAVLLSSTLSGTFASACAVARAEEFRRVTVVDSRTITLGLGLQALRAAELAAAGRTAAEIARHLEALRASSGGFFTVERLEYLLRSGRVGRARAWLGDLLDLKPILEVSAEGVYPLDRVRGSAALIPRVL